MKIAFDVDDLFAQIMANSRKNQYMLLEKMGQTLREPYEAIDEINKKNCKVVYQGVPGAYSYAAMINFFGKDVDNFNVPTWRECMEAVKQGKADYAVLPIENSNAGIVADVYDLLQEYNNYIIAETYVKIEHLLLGLPETDLENVTAVYSHPQGLMQCDRFLDTHKDWQRISQANTALAAKMIFQEHNKTHVAIASKEAAELYGLDILKSGITDQEGNTTRFVIVTNTRKFVKNAQKMSIVFETANEAGTVCRDYVIVTCSTFGITGKDCSCFVANNFNAADHWSSWFLILCCCIYSLRTSVVLTVFLSCYSNFTVFLFYSIFRSFNINTSTFNSNLVTVYSYICICKIEFIFFFRKAKGKIQARVDFVYGEVIYSTDPKHEVSTEQAFQVLRDTVEEKRVLDLFRMYRYQKNETGYERPLPSGEELYAFFRTELSVFRQFGEVRLGRKLRELYLDAHKHQPKIEVTETGSWLDIRFDVTGIEEQEIDHVLQSLLRNDAFYTLENGQVLSFDSEEFQQTSQVLQQLRESIRTEEGTIHVPKNQGLIIQNQLEKSNATFSESFQTMVQDLIHPERYQAQLPKGLNATMRDYQKQGFRWLKMLGHYQFGGILADEMGLGKTLQTIAFLLSEKEERKSFSALIVAPASLIYNWQAEVRKFAPSLSIQVINGNKKEREELLAKDTDIRVTSYASLRQDLANYQSQKIDYLILDEAQMVKNSSTKTAQALRELAVPQRFALSGTPIENNLEELWSLFATIMPGFFPTKTKFRELAAEEIAQMIRPFILRRDKQTVLKDLPEKTEMNLYSALTEEQKTVYLAYLRQMREEITSMDSEAFKKNRIGILAGLTRLRQICCDPRLFIEDYQGGSGKLEQVKDLLVAAKENKRRVLLFSQFTGMLTILQEELAELGISTFYLRGSTKPQDRLSMVDAFNAGEKDVFLISLKAGGTGLNLTGADTVILYDLWWNPAIEEQAAGRAHRIGQKNVVEVWRMISEGTIEERMDSLQQEKRELFQKVIQGNEEQLTKLTEEDIRMILSVGEIEE